MIDLKDEYLQIIRKIIHERFPDCKILVYGSRINGKSWEFSDIDIAIDNETKISWSKLYDLKEALSLTDIPIIVDICDYNDISDNFRKVILDNYELV
jgi:predicted nucleotidyltransferase